MKDFFKEIFEYHHYFNKVFIQQFQIHGKNLPSQTYALFCHVINAHQIWNSRILNLPSVGVNDTHPLEKCLVMEEENYTTTLDILRQKALEERIVYRNSRGIEFSDIIKDILFHIINHSTHHKGQIVADFRKQGISPVVTDYIFYKRQ